MRDAYKDEASRERMRGLTTALVDFLQKNNLLVNELLSDVHSIPDNLIIRSLDLTPEGLEVMGAGLDKWLRSNDDNRKPISIRSLENAMKKVVGREGSS